ncbi:MAG: FHA domain-containing protein [Myxococcota bacterium]
MSRQTARWGSALVAVLVGAWSLEAHAKLVIDNIDAEKFKDTGKIVFFADILDESTNAVLKDQPADQIKLFVDDKEVPGTFQVQTFKEANQAIAVAGLVVSHGAYAAGPDKDQGLTVNPLAEEMKGFKGLFEGLSDQDRVTVFYVNEEGFKQVAPWSNDPAGLASKANDPSLIKTAVEKKQTPPPLYKAIDAVLKSFSEDAANQPRRRVLVVMADGTDDLPEKQRAGKIKAIAETAVTPEVGVKVYAFGFTLGSPEPLTDFGTLAVKTNGIYREIPFDKQETIETAIAGLATELKNQYVLTFTASEDFRGSEKPVNMRLELKTKSGIEMKRPVEGVKIGERPAQIMKWVILGGIILGSLLGLFLIWKLIKAIIKRSKNKKVEVVQEEAYSGPYKGKLTCLTGAYAGREFFLTEDVTTIGAISGNSIVLQEAGVSKRHAGIKIEEMRFELADFGSTNGTWVNGAKITKQFLRDGDEVRIGDAKLKFSLK